MFFQDEGAQFPAIYRGDSSEIAPPVLISNSDCFTDLNAQAGLKMGQQGSGDRDRSVADLIGTDKKDRHVKP